MMHQALLELASRCPLARLTMSPRLARLRSGSFKTAHGRIRPPLESHRSPSVKDDFGVCSRPCERQ